MKISGVELEDIDFLKDQIKHHFGSLTKFATVSGINYRKVLNMLSNLNLDQESFDWLKGVYKKDVDKNKIPFRIDEEDREKIRICILTHFNSYTKFCEKHKEFDVVYITNVVKGNLKLRSAKYHSLIKVLNSRYQFGGYNFKKEPRLTSRK